MTVGSSTLQLASVEDCLWRGENESEDFCGIFKDPSQSSKLRNEQVDLPTIKLIPAGSRFVKIFRFYLETIK